MSTLSSSCLRSRDKLLLVKRIIQVNHAGEHGAINVYKGQIMVSKWLYKDLVPMLSDFKQHEHRHFAIFSQFSTERAIPTCGVLPLWGLGGWVLGTGTALLGRNAIMTCTSAIETAVGRHMAEQLEFLHQLGTEDKLHDAIKDIQTEELEHRDAANERVKVSVVSRMLDYLIQQVTHAAIVVAYHS